MNWEQLIAISRLLAGPPAQGEARGRPQQARLRRAISTAYYAMFHALAESNANTLIGASNDLRNSPEWVRTYRSLDHGRARSQMISTTINQFPDRIFDFAETFVYLQELRHDADYNPLSVLLALKSPRPSSGQKRQWRGSSKFLPGIAGRSPRKCCSPPDGDV